MKNYVLILIAAIFLTSSCGNKSDKTGENTPHSTDMLQDTMLPESQLTDVNSDTPAVRPTGSDTTGNR